MTRLDAINRLWRNTVLDILLIFPVFCVPRGLDSQVHAGSGEAPSGAAVRLSEFDVVSVRPANDASGGWRMQFTPDGFVAENVTLRMLSQDAFGIREEYRLRGEPSWFDTTKFDIFAKVDEEHVDEFEHLKRDQLAILLRAILTGRFHLKSHVETREYPIYVLLKTKNGPKLAESSPVKEGNPKGMHVIHSAPHLAVERGTMEYLAQMLSIKLGRTVVDRTGLTGKYDFSLNWTPESQTTVDTPDGLDKNIGTPPDTVGPSIFTALQEQLGLKLESQRGPIEIRVIDSIEQPNPN